VEPRRHTLELPKCFPLRLADGLAGRLDRDLGRIGLAHLREPPRFRFTRRGFAGAFGLAGSGFGAAPFPAASSASVSRGGVREERFGAVETAAPFAPGLAISLRVTSPCPTVHRFVVIQ